MNRKEFLMLVSQMKILYPDRKILPTEESMEAWFRQLEDIPYPHAELVLRKHNCTSNFPPTVADFRREMTPEPLSEGEAWALFLKAIKNSGTESVKEFNNLPKILQRVAGSPAALKEIALNENFNASVEMGIFSRKYRSVVESEKKYEVLPERLKIEYRESLQELAERKQLQIGGME